MNLELFVVYTAGMNERTKGVYVNSSLCSCTQTHRASFISLGFLNRAPEYRAPEFVRTPAFIKTPEYRVPLCGVSNPRLGS